MTHPIDAGGPPLTATVAGAAVARAAWFEGAAAGYRWLANEAAQQGDFYRAWMLLDRAMLYLRLVENQHRYARKATRMGLGPVIFRLEAA